MRFGWDAARGYVACGGEKGLLKVLRLDATPSADPRVVGVAAKTELGMNQTMERHEGACVGWGCACGAARVRRGAEGFGGRACDARGVEPPV